LAYKSIRNVPVHSDIINKTDNKNFSSDYHKLCFFRRFFSVNNLEILSHISPIASAINSHKTISTNVVYSAGSLADLKNGSKIGAKGEIICGRETVIKTYALLKGALLIAELVFKKINLAIAHVQMYIYFMCQNSIKIAFGYPETERS
uniref:Acyl-CoA_dh_1 domain-containing protein n=1 Tax=Brugia timori TaxID=42155 RepID=A0A0R3R6Q8_9BILA